MKKLNNDQLIKYAKSLNNKKSWDQLENIVENGIKEGYPNCCIKAFIEDLAAGRLPALERPPKGTVHIECQECYELTPDP